MNKQELIKHYENHLQKVIIAHNPSCARTELEKDKCFGFIKQAKKDLEEVKNGREW
jgi:hypothetical protein